MHEGINAFVRCSTWICDHFRLEFERWKNYTQFLLPSSVKEVVVPVCVTVLVREIFSISFDQRIARVAIEAAAIRMPSHWSSGQVLNAAASS